MPVQNARTLAEAYLYLSLVTGAEPGDDEAFDYQVWTTLTEGPEAWTLRFDGTAAGRGGLIELVVRYESESEARQSGVPFGTGTSELIDPGQWMQVSAVYARRALREGLYFSQDPTDGERFENIVLDWEFAQNAAFEAVKFIPDDADEVPAEAFWTPSGQEAHRESPERFTRARLVDDIAFHQKSLDDFRRLYGR